MLLETLYWEQVCRLRRSVTPRGRTNAGDSVGLFRGILLRLLFYQYCLKIFPKLQADVKIFGTWEWYNKEYGMSRTGRITGAPPDSDDDKPLMLTRTRRGRHASRVNAS